MTAAPVDEGTTPAEDPKTTAGKIAAFEERREAAAHSASEKAVEKQHSRGKRTARERIEANVHPLLALEAMAISLQLLR